ncbi:MAG: hypothetical protein GY822_07315 [Deltaproteobacteria bacterium]|nr:hypothetical protein [Deltaproteobacteria bacterium]
MTAFYLDKAWLIVSEIFAREMATRFSLKSSGNGSAFTGAIVLGGRPRR